MELISDILVIKIILVLFTAKSEKTTKLQKLN